MVQEEHLSAACAGVRAHLLRAKIISVLFKERDFTDRGPPAETRAGQPGRVRVRRTVIRQEEETCHPHREDICDEIHHKAKKKKIPFNPHT